MLKKNIKNSKATKGSTMENSMPLNNPMSGVFDFGGIGGGYGAGNYGAGPYARVTPLSEPWEMIYNNSYYMLSQLRVVLTYAYVIHGPLRTLVDLPVYDAFRGGIHIKTDEVSPEELEDFNRKMKKLKVVRKTIDAMRWGRLYGGAGLILNCDQDFSKPFNLDTITPESKLSFIVADRWQLTWNGIPGSEKASFLYNPGGYNAGENILVANIHQTRVYKTLCEEAPSFIRQRLQGWSMSVLECVIREMNLYFKENNVLFELIDEAKVDVWKIEGFNSQILSKYAKAQTSMRIQIATWMKNFLNAVTLDAKDDYEQKQITFAGIAEIMKQIQIGIAAACRIPVSKLFGLSATGFSSGEDDLEVYNSIVEHQRDMAEDVLEKIIPVVMMNTWGFVPDDWSVEWKPLRVLKATEEQQVLDSKFTRHSTLYSQGIYNPQEYCEALKEDKLMNIETEVSKGAEPEPPMNAMMEEGMDEGSDSGAKSQGAKGKKEKTKEG